MKKILSTLLFSLAVFAIACGGDDNNDKGAACASDNECKGDRVCSNGSCVDPNGQNNANNQGNNANNQGNNANNVNTASCCLNGSFFDCNGDAAAAQACFTNVDPGSCTADSARDNECDGNANNVNNVNNANNNTGGDTGDSCRADADCTSELCLFADGAVVGYCTEVCQSFADCPTFWDCEEVGNGTGTYCVNNG